ncbi:MAG: hypothetical protein WB661_06410 [Candidatus Bathyarchaeia archaeon]
MPTSLHRRWLVPALLVFVAFTLIADQAVLPVSAPVTQMRLHVFAKGMTSGNGPTVYANYTAYGSPINVTNTFTQGDAYVYTIAFATFSATNFTWIWYDPTGAVYETDRLYAICGAASGALCTLYDRIAIAGTDAVTKLGTWRMTLFADRSILYSDSFQLISYTEEDDSWTFNVTASMHAHVSLDVTIHPYNGTRTAYLFSIPENDLTGNYSAYEYRTNKPLRVIHNVAGSKDKATVVFGAPKGDGYRFTATFDLAGAFRHAGFSPESPLILEWYWGSPYPIPMKVIVILPAFFQLGGVVGNYGDFRTTTLDNRTAVFFSGISPPNGRFHWIVTYAPVEQPSTLSTTSVVHTENKTGMTIQPITVPVSLENTPTGVSTDLTLLGLVVAALIVGSAAYVRRRHKPRP